MKRIDPTPAHRHEIAPGTKANEERLRSATQRLSFRRTRDALPTRIDTPRLVLRAPMRGDVPALAAGVVADGRLLRGRRGMAGHVGHMRLSAEGPRCPCGAVGCFEAFASGTALRERARLAASRQPEGFLAIAARGGDLDGRHILAGARAGDPVCRALLDEEAGYLARGFASLVHLYSPEMIVVGGGVSQAFDLMADRIAEQVRRDVMPPFRDVRIVPALLGDNSGLVGAAALAAQIGEALS